MPPHACGGVGCAPRGRACGLEPQVGLTQAVRRPPPPHNAWRLAGARRDDVPGGPAATGAPARLRRRPLPTPWHQSGAPWGHAGRLRAAQPRPSARVWTARVRAPTRGFRRACARIRRASRGIGSWPAKAVGAWASQGSRQGADGAWRLCGAVQRAATDVPVRPSMTSIALVLASHGRRGRADLRARQPP
jgi:hypothetical protein